MRNAIIAAAALLGLMACTATNPDQALCAADPSLPQCGDAGPAGDTGATADAEPDAATPAEEICNGKDDDGDGETDEDLEGKPCPKGEQNCINGEWACTPTDDATTPDAATPDALPGDALPDATPDIGSMCPDGVRACNVGATCTILVPTPPPPDAPPRPSDCWRVGTVTCDPCGNWDCFVDDARASEELCDGQDNNCDGAIDGPECTPFPREGDVDGDGVGDALDNCTDDFNIDQADVDDDGYGDICDNCPNTLNLGQADRDHDGVGDECDANPICADNRPPAGVDANCDGIDDDCDGESDEDWMPQAGLCDTGLADNQGALCSRGNLSCVGGAISCVPEDANDAERCNTHDDDCDGEIDEGLTWMDPLSNQQLGLGAACSLGQGICARNGVVECNFDRTAECNAEVVPPRAATDTCDGLDNDCDGQTDEDAISHGACPVGQGACARTGQQLCINGQYRCNVEPGLPSDETCDGLDNDCDGQTDENFTIAGPDNNLRIGADCVLRNEVGCEARGNVVCSVDQNSAICNATPPEPVTEICDGLDNDCDGVADNDLVDCCPQGFNSCGQCEPQPEDLCDGLDNDCDGLMDEDFAVEACDTGRDGICGLGTLACQNNAPRCIANNPPAAELCDNAIDEDCDGEWDEPDCCAPDQINACGTCGPLPEESCNGLDDDCDGEIDEGLTWLNQETQEQLPLGSACTVNNRLCQSNGTVVCNAEGSAICNAIVPVVSPEVCDGLDNDCDGITDPACNSCPEGTIVPEGWICAPAGTFQMGSPGNELFRRGDETQHEVILTRAFLVKTMEVNRSEWARMFGGEHPSEGCDECPVDNVSWYESIAYANGLSTQDGLVPCYLNPEGTEYALDDARLDPPAEPAFIGLDCDGYRLPTEAEWEYAARAETTGPIYTADPWVVAPDENGCNASAATDTLAWYLCNSEATVHPVGGLLPNPWGLHDVLGNAWEWTWDWHGAYPAGPVDDPTGPEAGARRAARGTSFQNHGREVRIAIRVPVAPTFRAAGVGFRLVRTINTPVQMFVDIPGDDPPLDGE